MHALSNFVGGSFVRSAADDASAHRNPSREGEVVALVPRGSEADVDAAVSSAAIALPGWRSMSAGVRADHLYRWSAAIAAKGDLLAQTMTREVGKPIGEARGEVVRCGMILRYFAGEAVRPAGQVIPAQLAGALQYTVREPVGVVALITPWNFPLAIPLWKAAPALAFGNTVVLKPSEYSSLAATLLAESALEAGLPTGVFNVVLGDGTSSGQPLIEHDGVAAISFTGSRRVGAVVSGVAARRNVRFQTEMGGKNIAIVLRDADLDRAAALVASGAVRYAGQKCTATSRVVVHSAVEGKFLASLRARVRELPLGPSEREDCAVGPLIHAAARERVLAFLADAAGARVEGGERSTAPDLREGNYVSPAIVSEISPGAELSQEEIFGPVITAFTARNIDEAIAIANDTRFGLSASLFTSDIRSALRYIDEIQVGMVRVNGDTTGVDPHAPFGGMKESGSGTREQGPAAREFYTATKTVQINA